MCFQIESAGPFYCAPWTRSCSEVATNAGAITTLGRGGSDLTATVIGAALGLEEVQVWKDVDGILPSIQHPSHCGYHG